MHQNIHVTNKIIHSTLYIQLLQERRTKERTWKKKKKKRHQSLCKIPFTLIFQVYNLQVTIMTHVIKIHCESIIIHVVLHLHVFTT